MLRNRVTRAAVAVAGGFVGFVGVLWMPFAVAFGRTAGLVEHDVGGLATQLLRHAKVGLHPAQAQLLFQVRFGHNR